MLPENGMPCNQYFGANRCPEMAKAVGVLIAWMSATFHRRVPQFEQSLKIHRRPHQHSPRGAFSLPRQNPSNMGLKKTAPRRERNAMTTNPRQRSICE
jgi:hypothetical protein